MSNGSAASEPTIKILVSCHKPSYIPDSDIYLPVRVGARGKVPIPGMQPDDEGENISDRNFTFSELSAQYWAWKNLDADYVGQCHYRRYFAFAQPAEKPNDHGQVEEKCLSDISARKYALDDTEAIRSEVTGTDIICPPVWNVQGVMTPGKNSVSVAEHMMAYALFEQQDLDVLVAIVKERQPDYYEDLLSYLQGNWYRGYNCFVMRRDAFNELCEFEFDVLLEFDREKDYSQLTRTKRRICGYFGEILFSTFIAHCQRLNKYRLTEKRLLFFQDVTPSLEDGFEDGQDGLVQIAWRWPHIDEEVIKKDKLLDVTLESVAVSLRSMFDHLSADKRYRVIMIHSPRGALPTLASALDYEIPDNIEIFDATWLPTIKPGLDGHLDDKEIRVFLPALLPHMLSGTHARILWIEGLAYFNEDPAKLLDAFPADASMLAMGGIRVERELNKPLVAPSARGKAREDSLHNYDSQVCLIDLDMMRKNHPIDQILGLTAREDIHSLEQVKSGEPLACGVLLGFLGPDIRPLSYQQAAPSLHLADTRAWANDESIRAYERPQKPDIVSLGVGMVAPADFEFRWCPAYWALARTMPVYERLMTGMRAIDEVDDTSLKDRLLPPDSKARKAVGKVYRIVRDNLKK